MSTRWQRRRRCRIEWRLDTLGEHGYTWTRIKLDVAMQSSYSISPLRSWMIEYSCALDRGLVAALARIPASVSGLLHAGLGTSNPWRDHACWSECPDALLPVRSFSSQ